MMSVLQTAAAAAETVVRYHAIEGASAVTLLTAALHMVRRFHKGEVVMTEKFGEVRGDVKTLTETVDNHIEHSPTLAYCAQQTALLERVVQAGGEKIRDETLAISLSRDGEVIELEKRIRVAEDWQLRHNETESNA